MKRLGKRLMSLGLSAILSATMFVSMGVQALAYTETTGTVATTNVKVRSEANTTASQISSLRQGDTVEIIDEATEWVDFDNKYMRHDIGKAIDEMEE